MNLTTKIQELCDATNKLVDDQQRIIESLEKQAKDLKIQVEIAQKDGAIDAFLSLGMTYIQAVNAAEKLK